MALVFSSFLMDKLLRTKLVLSFLSVLALVGDSELHLITLLMSLHTVLIFVDQLRPA